MAQDLVIAPRTTEMKSDGLYWQFLDDPRIALMVRGLGIIVLLNIAVGLYMALFYAPRERLMGDVQRIFYFHVPSAWVGFLAFLVVFIASVMFLRRREQKWDVLALCAAEVGVIFTTLVILTGPLWARGTWGKWWEWSDPKLTTFLILFTIYLSYLMLRATAEGERRKRIAAVLGIVGFLNVPIVYFSVKLWGELLHPPLMIGEGGVSDPRMVQTLMVALLAFTLLFFFLLIQRMQLEQARDRLESLRAEMEA